MNQIVEALLVLTLKLDLRLHVARRRDGQGSVTTEYVLWAVAVIAIVGLVVAAVKAYVESQAGNIN